MGNATALIEPTSTRQSRRTLETVTSSQLPLSLDDLIAQYGRLVATAARRVVGIGGDVDDIVQETWIVYLRSGSQVTDQRCLGGWLYQVANRLALRTVKRDSRTVTIDDPARAADLVTEQRDVDNDLLRHQQRRAIVEASTALRCRERELLELLLDDNDYGYLEISRRTGVPVGSLGPTRERLIRKLRAVPAVQRLADNGDMGDNDAHSCAA